MVSMSPWSYPFVRTAYRRRKEEPTTNCMSAYDFDMKLTFACVGWEGLAYQTQIFLSCLNRESDNFPKSPPGLYYCILINVL